MGPALASRVCARLNADMRGEVAIGSNDWPLASGPAVVRGGWVPVVLQDVQVADADGVVALDPRTSPPRLVFDVTPRGGPGELVVERANRLRLAGVHYTVPGPEGTYDCILDPGPAVERSCEGRSAGDARALLRLRTLDTW